MDNNEKLKKYHFKRENYKKTSNLKSIKSQLPREFVALKQIAQGFLRQNLSLKIEETIKAVDEFIIYCEKVYGENLEAIERIDDEKRLNQLHQTIEHLIQEVKNCNYPNMEEHISQSMNNYFKKRGIDFKRILRGYPVSTNKSNQAAEKITIQTQPDLDTLIVLKEDTEETRD